MRFRIPDLINQVTHCEDIPPKLLITKAPPPSMEPTFAVRGGLFNQEVFAQVRQREELVGATQLRSIRTNRSSLICRCQGPDLR